MCQTKQIWSNACKHSQRFETILCKLTQPKQAYTWRPSPWHTRHFRYGTFILWSKFSRHFFQHCWRSHGQWSLPIQISLDKPLKWNTPLTEQGYRFDKADNDLFNNTLNDSLNSIDTDITMQDELEELAVTLCNKLMKAVVDTFPPKT